MKDKQGQQFIIKIGLAALVVLLSVGILWRGLLVPLGQEKEAYKVSRLLFAKVDKKAGLKNELEKEFEKISKDVEVIRQSILGIDRTLEFIETLESIGALTNNIYTTNTVQEVKNESGVIEYINFSMELEGSFSSLLSFFRELKALPYLMNFAQVSIEISNEETNLLKANAVLKVYVK